MEKTQIDDVDSWTAPATIRRPLSEAVDAENVAINYFELDTGETFGFGYHRHPDQEEVFYILEGTATFETESGEVEVTDGELVRFAPGEWQLGRNDSEERVRALALGAPQESPNTEVRRHCPDCGDRQPTQIERADDEDAVVTRCESCGSETGRFR